MAQTSLACDREQSFLLPPDVREWLPGDHLAWFVIDAVGVMDLSRFYTAYREDGHGRAAYEPSVMVALLLYGWSRGIRSSRAIERACVEDVACRVIAAHQQPDHATIARFVERHECALAELFGEGLALCADAGLATVGVIAIDGTKVHANASRDRTMDYEQLARAIIEEAIDTDAAETDAFGDRRGDELPEIVASRQGREGWLRAARQRLEQRRAEQPQPVARSRHGRLLDGKRRLEEELAFERHGNECYEAYRARGVMKNGRRLGSNSTPKPYTPPDTPAGKVNLTDPDSKLVHGMRGWIQGCNAQAVCNERHLILAAEVMTASPDFGHLGPMVAAAQSELAAAGVTESPAVVVADAGYWHLEQMKRSPARASRSSSRRTRADASTSTPARAGTAALTTSFAASSTPSEAASSTSSAPSTDPLSGPVVLLSRSPSNPAWLTTAAGHIQPRIAPAPARRPAALRDSLTRKQHSLKRETGGLLRSAIDLRNASRRCDSATH